MLSPKYLSEVAVSVIKLYENVEDEILKDIARRIKKASKVTGTAQRQMEVLIENGYSYQDLQTKLKPYLENIDKEISKVLDESTIKHYYDEKKAYERANKHLIDYKKNDRANMINRQIKDDLLRNNKILTNSLGFAYDGKAYTIDNFYRKELNKNILMVSSGAFDRESATRKLINALGDSGVKSINYNKSGRNYSIESASRMLIRTAVSQLTGEISLMNAEDMGQDLMEISAHIGARPSHAVWQGKIVSLSGTNSKYLTLDDIGYGEVTGFKGANCRHDWYPFFEGISERIYDDEDLENLDPEGFEFEGKEYNYYEATQKQRQIERSIRKYKQKVMMFDEVGDSEAKLANQVRLQRQRQLYKDFNKAGKLRGKTSNINVYGYNRSKASKEVWANRKAQKKANELYNLGSDKLNLDIYLKDEKLRKEIRSDYNLTINPGRQDKHIQGTNNYIQELKQGRYKSYLLEGVDPQQLVDKYAGTGELRRVGKIGKWINKEFIEADENIGYWVYEETGKGHITNRFTISYSKEKGTHIVPARPKEL